MKKVLRPLDHHYVENGYLIQRPLQHYKRAGFLPLPLSSITMRRLKRTRKRKTVKSRCWSQRGKGLILDSGVSKALAFAFPGAMLGAKLGVKATGSFSVCLNNWEWFINKHYKRAGLRPLVSLSTNNMPWVRRPRRRRVMRPKRAKRTRQIGVGQYGGIFPLLMLALPTLAGAGKPPRWAEWVSPLVMVSKRV